MPTEENQNEQTNTTVPSVTGDGDAGNPGGDIFKPMDYTPAQIDDPQRTVTGWQKFLFITGIVAVLGIFTVFIWVTISQADKVQDSINNSPSLEDSTLVKLYTSATPEKKKDILDASMILLENQNLKKRYHNANVILKSQIYIKYLGFLTGMILSVLGAIFVFGKFREYPTRFSSNGGIENNFKVQLQSTSPGIILSLLGTILMIITILSKKELEVKDGAVYIKMSIPATFNDSDTYGKTPKNEKDKKGDTAGMKNHLFNE